VIRSRGRAFLARLTPRLRLAAIAAALVCLAILLKRIAATSTGDSFLLANRALMVYGLIATVSATGALLGGRPSRGWVLVMVVAVCVGLVALVYGTWVEIAVNALKHACWTCAS
jgi:hypothetical protein